MQYRASMWMSILSQFLLAFFAYIAIQTLFERFQSISGFSFHEVCLCFGITVAAFSIAEMMARGFDLFSRLITSGDFDRIMLRPRSTVLQVLGGSFEISKLGRLAQSLIVLGAAMRGLGIASPGDVALVALMLASAVVIFTGLFILGATVCFFTIQGLEFINIFTDGGRELASYPLPVYPKWVMRFFTFVIPFGCFNYLPLMYIAGRAGAFAPLYALMPLIGMLFIIPCLVVWNFGVRRYLSTGS